MARTQTQAAKMTRSRARFWSAQVGLSMMAVVALSVATAFAQEDKSATQTPKSTKGDASDAATKREKSSNGSSAKGEHSSKGEKSWVADSSTPKPITHRPRPNVDLKDSAAVAAAVDKLILANLTESGTQPAPRTSDEDFLRRIHFDLVGTVPMPREVTLFGLDPDPRSGTRSLSVCSRAMNTPTTGPNYWRDVIFLRATDMKSRIVEGTFEKWMSDQIRENSGWDKIVTKLLTAIGARRRSWRNGIDVRAGRTGRRDGGRKLANFPGHSDSVRQLPRPSVATSGSGSSSTRWPPSSRASPSAA